MTSVRLLAMLTMGSLGAPPRAERFEDALAVFSRTDVSPRGARGG